MFILIIILKHQMQTSVQTLAILIAMGVIIYGGTLLVLKDKFVYDGIEQIKERIRKIGKNV